MELKQNKIQKKKKNQKISNRKCNALSCTKLPNLQNFHFCLFRGPAAVWENFELLDFSEKVKRTRTFS